MAINVTGSSITGGVPSSRNLVFTAWSEFPLLFYSWTFAQTATGQTFPVTVAADTRSMAIPPGTLAGGRTYRVTLTVADPTGFYSGQTTKDFTVYNVPSGGTLAVDRVDVIPSVSGRGR